MNMKVKTTIVIIATLIFGIVLGAMLNRTYMHQRIKRAFDAVNPNRFVMILERAIEPTKEQKKRIREILQKNAQSVAELRKKLDEGMRTSFMTLQKELDSVLTPEQKERLEKIVRQRRPWMKRERRLRRPPPKFPPDKKLPRNL